jgi:hypothetical protein
VRMVVLVLLALVVWAASAASEEFVFGLDGETGFNSNVTFTRDDEERSSAYRLSPWLQIRRTQGDLRYKFRSRLSYEDFPDVSGDADSLDQFVSLQGQYRFGATTKLDFVNQFARVKSLSQILQVLDPSATPDVEVERRRVLRNFARLSGEHSFSRRWLGRLKLSHTLFEFDNPDSFDSDTLSGDGSLIYSLSPRDQIGFGLGVTRSRFDDARSRPGGRTDYLQAFGIWDHEFDPTLSLSLQAGPVYIDSDRDGAGSLSHDRVSVFAIGKLVKTWESVTASLRYERTQSTSSGAGQGTLLDAVIGTVLWRPSRRWDLSVVGSWAGRESATNQTFVLSGGAWQEVSTDDRINQFRVGARAERQFTRRLSVFGFTSWLGEKPDGDAFQNEDLRSRFILMLGFRWQFEPGLAL